MVHGIKVLAKHFELISTHILIRQYSFCIFYYKCHCIANMSIIDLEILNHKFGKKIIYRKSDFFGLGLWFSELVYTGKTNQFWSLTLI